MEIASLAFGKLAMKKMDSHFHGNDRKKQTGWMNPTPTLLKFKTFYFVLYGANEGV